MKIRRLLKSLRLMNLSCAGIVCKILDLHLEQPVFIIGTGRCGSTLLTQILCSNPDIIAFPGEANDLWHPKLYPFGKAQILSLPIEITPDSFTRLSIENWPVNHSETIKRIFNGFHLMAGKEKVFFVKSAMISFMMPHIVTIFPDAKFIHIYRYGPSVVESYFKKNFKNKNYSQFNFTETDYYRACAKYWNSCILRIEYDKTSLSLTEKNSFFEFSYEDLCDDPQSLLKDLSSYLNVEYEKFTFNLSTIRSTNYKVDNTYRDAKFKHLIDSDMYLGMKLKRYIS